MTRTEEDLRGLYRDQPELSTIEARLASWAAGQPAAARDRSGLSNWAAPVASAAAVAAVTVAIVSLPHGHGGDAGSAPVPGAAAVVAPLASRPVPSMPVTNTPVTITVQPPVPPQLVTITPQFAAQQLLGLLPHAGKVTDLGGTAFDNEILVTMNVNDGHGVAGIYLTLSYPVAPGTQRLGWSCTPDIVASQRPAPDCKTLADGTQVHTDDSLNSPLRNPANPNSLVIGVLRPDGVQVEITENDGPVDTKFVVTRKSLAFTKAELLAVDLDPIWNTQITKSAADSAEHLFTPAPGGYPVTPPLLSGSPTAPAK